MLTLFFLLSLLCVFAGAAAFAIGFFMPPPMAEFEAAFKVNVDNLNRSTIFDMPELRWVLWPFLQITKRVTPANLRSRVLRNLRSSANPNGYSPDEFLTLCLLTGVGVGLGLMLFQAGMMSVSPSFFTALVGFMLGFWGRELYLASQAQTRLRRIAQQLPYGLDLIAMTMQAGATFYEAGKTVAEENPKEPFNQEMGIVVREIEFGRSRQEALQHLGDRIPVDSLSGIIAAVLQAEQLGTPLAEVLRLQANLLRMYRSMRAEKLLGEATVKLLIPSVLIFMSALLIVFGPIIVRFFRGDLWGT